MLLEKILSSTEDSVSNKELELQTIIENAVDSAVDRAFQKHGLKPKRKFMSLRNIIIIITVIAVILCGLIGFAAANRINDPVSPIEDHDLTLENNGIFGFTVVDFSEVILGEATRQKLLIVEEREAYVNTTITDTGLFNLGVLNKQQTLTIHGIGQYTIDLTQIKNEHIQLNEETFELTIQIPHAILHHVTYDPSKTEIGDTKKGWLAMGDITLTPEETKAFEVRAKEELTLKLSEATCFEEADRFAKLSAFETYQPIIKSVSPAYKVIIEFQE